jgi:hypothetical protein
VEKPVVQRQRLFFLSLLLPHLAVCKFCSAQEISNAAVQLPQIHKYTAFLCLLPDLCPQFRKFLYKIFKRKALATMIEA